MKLRVYIFILLLLLACPLAAMASDDYVVGAEDVLKITVYNYPDLTTTERVSGEGVITIPLIGEIKVAGMTTDRVAKAIAEKLADGFIVDPNVSVFVLEFRSKKAIVMGQVNKPGIYMLTGNTTFLELLSLAGGLTKDAGSKATIKRKTSDGTKGEGIITIDLKKLIEEGDTSLDVSLMDGDNVYIAKAGVFYLTGEIKTPAAYKYEDGLTLIKAVTMAGGFTDKASPGRIRIIRKIDNKEKVIQKAEMDEPVLPEDIIIVPESFF
jgi:polysaccharide export outer membrane protein